MIKPVKGNKYKTKTVFLPKVSNIQLNYAFLLFWSILEEIHIELLFLVQKVTISERRTEILTNLLFSTCLKKGKSWGKIDLFKQLFLIKPVKGDNIKKICFYPHTEPHTAKLCFSVVLNLFRRNSQRTSLFSPKSDYLRKEH